MAHAGVVYYRWPNPGFIRISGDDRADFLQRQSTNDVRLLTPTRAVTTVLTSPTARILDVLTLLDEGDSIAATTLAGRAASTTAMLQGKIFFMDKVSVRDESARVHQVDIEGVGVDEVMHKLGLHPLHRDDAVQMMWGGGRLWVIGRNGLMGRGLRLVASADATDELVAWLEAQGAVSLTDAAREVMRIEARLPEADRELSEDYNPLEVGLAWTVAENKGCYTGQEIIARQITYDKVTRRLVQLALEEPVEAPLPVYLDGKPIGQITSAAVSPRRGPLALAVLKRPYCDQSGAAVFVGPREIPAIVQ